MECRAFAVVLAVAAAACGSPDATDPPGWMSTQPDSASLASLTIPGTHDSMALYEPIAGVAKTQTLALADQYAAGVRYVDIRCHDIDDSFAIYHGIIDEQATFDDVLDATFEFLDAHPTETIVMSVKEEGDAEGATIPFDAAFAPYLAKHPGGWYTGDAVPALGGVRGQIVLLRRFATTATTPLGIDGSQWADNTTFTLTPGAATLRIEDNYTVDDPATKWTNITNLFDEARTLDDGTWYIAYTSGYETHSGLPNITDVSGPINDMLDGYLADPTTAGAHLGTLAMDMITTTRVAALAALNGSGE
jgi:1-phosphatidylinositol phosphodiesterase|nr:phosphatidylinositol-specific phospholipase C [Kofleriaceae bacterium]